MPIARLKAYELEAARAKKLRALATAVSSTRNARPHEVDTSRVVKLNAIRAALVTATTIPATFPKLPGRPRDELRQESQRVDDSCRSLT